MSFTLQKIERITPKPPLPIRSSSCIKTTMFRQTTFIYHGWIAVLQNRLPIMIATKFEILLNGIKNRAFLCQQL